MNSLGVVGIYWLYVGNCSKWEEGKVFLMVVTFKFRNYQISDLAEMLETAKARVTAEISTLSILDS